jgi:hypothetical protein
MYPDLTSDGFFFGIVALAIAFNLGIMVGRLYQIATTIHTEWMARRAAMAATKARYSRTVRRRTIKAVGKFARAVAHRTAQGASGILVLASSLRPSGVPSIADHQ